VFAKFLSGLFAAVVLSGLCCGQIRAQSHAHRGAVAGGATGAIIGGIIGHQNNETPEGILLGGAVGALAGSLLGHEHDQQIRRDYYYQQQLDAAWQNGVSLNDVVTLTRNGVASDVIINQIRMNGVQQRIGVNEIIALHQQGVQARVIDAMQHAPLAGEMRRRPAAAVYETPVLIEPVPVIPAAAGCRHGYPWHVYPRPPRSHGAGFYFRYGW
jgi:hypothetical protein